MYDKLQLVALLSRRDKRNRGKLKFAVHDKLQLVTLSLKLEQRDVSEETKAN